MAGLARLLHPRGSTSSLERLIRDTFGGYGTVSGVRVTPDSAMHMGAVYACVLVLSQSVAQLPLHLFRRSGDTRQRVSGQPLSRFVEEQPNEWMTAYEFKQLIMVHLLLRGNSYWLKTRGAGGQVRELIPISPDRIKGIEQDALFRVFYKVKRSGSEKEIDTIPGEDLLHIKGLSYDSLQGLNPIEYAREMMGLYSAAEQHGAKLFSQGTRMGGVLQHPGTLSDEAATRLRESFNEMHSGVANAHKTALLEEGMKWESISMTADDAQFLESRQYQRSEIAGFFRVPAHFINDLEHATFSNVEHLDLAFVKHSLMPWLVNIEQTLRRSLLTPPEKADHYFKFIVDGILRGDSVSRAQSYQQAIMNGWLNPNEVRELEDRDPYEGGDAFRIPTNMTTVSSNQQTP